VLEIKTTQLVSYEFKSYTQIKTRLKNIINSTNGMAQSMEQVQVLDSWEEIDEHEARWL